jgi:hypothetical protein
MAHHSTPMPRAGWSVESLIPSRQTAPDSSFVEEDGPGVLLNAGFWLGGLASLAVWTGIWTSIAWILDRI